MKRSRLRRWVVVAGGAVVLVAALALLRTAGARMAAWQRATPALSPLNLPGAVLEESGIDLKWLPDRGDTGRIMEPVTRRQIEEAYLRAWIQLGVAYARQSPEGLATYFVGPQLADLTEAVTETAAAGRRVHLETTGHRLQLLFYSADGSIVSLRDVAAQVRTDLTNDDGDSLGSVATIDQYAVVMFLEDGNWRVRHWQRRAATPAPAEPVEAAPLPPDPAAPN